MHITCCARVQKVKIITGLDMSNLTKNRKSTILSETVHNPSSVTLTMLMNSFA